MSVKRFLVRTFLNKSFNNTDDLKLIVGFNKVVEMPKN